MKAPKVFGKTLFTTLMVVTLISLGLSDVFSKAFHSPIISVGEVKVARAAVHLHYKMQVRCCPKVYEVLSEGRIKIQRPESVSVCI